MMNKKIAAGALALTLAAGGTAAVTHTYAASASDSASKTADASVAAPKATGTAADPLQADKAGKGPRGGPGLAGGPAAERAELAALLNLTQEQLRTQQESGKTLSAIAAEQKVDEQKLIALLVSKHQAKLAEELAAGKITQAQYNERLAEAQERAGEKLDRVFDAKAPHGPAAGAPAAPGADGNGPQPGAAAGAESPAAAVPVPAS